MTIVQIWLIFIRVYEWKSGNSETLLQNLKSYSIPFSKNFVGEMSHPKGFGGVMDSKLSIFDVSRALEKKKWATYVFLTK